MRCNDDNEVENKDELDDDVDSKDVTTIPEPDIVLLLMSPIEVVAVGVVKVVSLSLFDDVGDAKQPGLASSRP